MRHLTIRGPDGPRPTSWTFEVPTTRRERGRGLRGRGFIATGHGMLFERCRSVHTFGMAFPILVVALDRELKVVYVRTLAPRRVLFPRLGSRHLLECRADADVRPGDRFAVVRGLSAAGGKRPAVLRPSR